MGRSFDGRAPRASVASARALTDTVISRGVHGWRGRLARQRRRQPGSSSSCSSRRCRATCWCSRCSVRRLRISVDDPDGLVDAVGGGSACLTAPTPSARAPTRGTTRSSCSSRAAGMSGLEALQLIAAGELPPPPIAKTLGFGPIEVEEGRATFTIEPAEFHYNPIGVVHGGLALALLDSAMGCAVHSTLAAGVAYTTLEVKANFVRPLTSSTGLDPVHGDRGARRPDRRDRRRPGRRRRRQALRARDEHAAHLRRLTARRARGRPRGRSVRHARACR